MNFRSNGMSGKVLQYLTLLMSSDLNGNILTGLIHCGGFYKTSPSIITCAPAVAVGACRPDCCRFVLLGPWLVGYRFAPHTILALTS